MILSHQAKDFDQISKEFTALNINLLTSVNNSKSAQYTEIIWWMIFYNNHPPPPNPQQIPVFYSFTFLCYNFTHEETNRVVIEPEPILWKNPPQRWDFPITEGHLDFNTSWAPYTKHLPFWWPL